MAIIPLLVYVPPTGDPEWVEAWTNLPPIGGPASGTAPCLPFPRRKTQVGFPCVAGCQYGSVSLPGAYNTTQSCVATLYDSYIYSSDNTTWSPIPGTSQSFMNVMADRSSPKRDACASLAMHAVGSVSCDWVRLFGTQCMAAYDWLQYSLSLGVPLKQLPVDREQACPPPPAAAAEEDG